MCTRDRPDTWNIATICFTCAVSFECSSIWFSGRVRNINIAVEGQRRCRASKILSSPAFSGGQMLAFIPLLPLMTLGTTFARELLDGSTRKQCSLVAGVGLVKIRRGPRRGSFHPPFVRAYALKIKSRNTNITESELVQKVIFSCFDGKR